MQLLSIAVFAGSQLAAVQLLAAGAPGFIAGLTAALMNLRHVVYSLTLAPAFKHLAWPWRLLAGYLTTDETYNLVLVRMEREAEAHPEWFLLGGGSIIWAAAQIGTALGGQLGQAVPASWSLDFNRDARLSGAVDPPGETSAGAGHSQHRGEPRGAAGRSPLAAGIGDRSRRWAGGGGAVSALAWPAASARQRRCPMILLLLLAGPPTYLMRASGFLLARTRLVPRQMASTLALVSTAALAALVAPSVLIAQGRLSIDPLENPRLLVALLLGPLLWLARRHEQLVLLGTPLVGMGLLWGLSRLSTLTFTLSLPLALLLVAGASLLLLGSRQVGWRFWKQRGAGLAGVAARSGGVRVLPAEGLRVPARAASLPVQQSRGQHTHCIRCWCPLPDWANFCGQCGLLQPVQNNTALPAPARWAARTVLVASRYAPASDLAPTQPLAVVTVRPRRTISAFWLLWTGQTISALGSAFTLFALPLLVYKLTGSPLTLGISTAVEVLPYFLFGLLIGAWVDRLPRKPLLLVSTILQAGTLAVIPGLFLLGALSVWWLYGLAFVSTILKQGSETCQIALLPGLVESDRLTTANGQLQAGVSTAQLVGPVLAGALVLLVPLPLLLLVDAASFVLAGGLFAGLRVRFPQAAVSTRQTLRQAMRGGLRYVWRDPVLRSISLLTPLVNGLSIVVVSQLVLFARVQYHASPSAMSLLYAATSGGYLLFSLLAGPLRRHCPFSLTTLGALALMGVLIGLMGMTSWFWPESVMNFF